MYGVMSRFLKGCDPGPASGSPFLVPRDGTLPAPVSFWRTLAKYALCQRFDRPTDPAAHDGACEIRFVIRGQPGAVRGRARGGRSYRGRSGAGEARHYWVHVGEGGIENGEVGDAGLFSNGQELVDDFTLRATKARGLALTTSGARQGCRRLARSGRRGAFRWRPLGRGR